MRKRTAYTTPPGEILTPTPSSDINCISGATAAEFFSLGKISCKCVNICAAPQLIKYDFVLSDIFKYNEAKLKRLLKAFSARYKVDCVLNKSSCGDFAIVAARNDRPPLYLRSVIYTNSFNSASRTACAIGVDTQNNTIIIDIATAPHILIAGTTGSGKSVLLNSLICSLLYKVTPSIAQFIMIDPKQVELAAYNNLPLLQAPIITDVSRAVETLRSTCSEIERRYKILAKAGYKSLTEAPALFPRIYVFIDELADLMLTSKKAVEEYIVRIAQIGRAAGVHLIIATQRPTTNILTGLIKANIPTKIALTVSNSTDSCTILNHGGAEKLTGRGDAIIQTPDSITERRFQTVFTPENDITNIVQYCKSQAPKQGLFNLFRKQ